MAISDASAGSAGSDDPQVAYHIEVRQFPHNACRFNLTQEEMWVTVVEPWTREQWLEMGERQWSAHQAKLTILEGPHIPVEQLSMGRGWRAAQRQGRDVTEQLLAAAASEAEDSQASAPATQAQEARPVQDDGLLADSLGLELLTVLGAGRAPLRRAWELARARDPERTAGQCLTLAEHAVGSLLQSGLIALVRIDAGGETVEQIDEAEAEAVLEAVDSWTGDIVALTRR